MNIYSKEPFAMPMVSAQHLKMKRFLQESTLITQIKYHSQLELMINKYVLYLHYIGWHHG